MAGQVKRMIDEIFRQRAKGDPTLISTTKTKLILKGINPDKFTALTEDDPGIMHKVQAAAAEMGVKL